MERHVATKRSKTNGDELASAMQDATTKLKDQSLNAWVRTRDYVKSNPGKSVFALAVLGLVLNRVLRSRS